MAPYNPWKGNQIGPAWQAVMAAATHDWIPVAELIAVAMDAGGIVKSTAQNLLNDALKYGVLVSHGSYDKKAHRDYREYRLLPANLAHKNARQWYSGSAAARPTQSEAGRVADPTPEGGKGSYRPSLQGKGTPGRLPPVRAPGPLTGKGTPVAFTEGACFSLSRSSHGGDLSAYRQAGRADAPVREFCEWHQDDPRIANGYFEAVEE